MKKKKVLSFDRKLVSNGITIEPTEKADKFWEN